MKARQDERTANYHAAEAEIGHLEKVLDRLGFKHYRIVNYMDGLRIRFAKAEEVAELRDMLSSLCVTHPHLVVANDSDAGATTNTD